MKRNPETIRAICLAVENSPTEEWVSEVDGIDEAEFVHHTKLMQDAGLLIAKITEATGFTECEIERLTWDGHDFAEACRNQTIWEKAKKSVIAPGAAWTLDLLKEWLKSEVSKGFSALG